MQIAKRIALEELQRVLKYDPDTGEFFWRVDDPRGGKIKIGTRAGGIDRFCNRGIIKVEGQRYKTARLAWFYMTGEWAPAIKHRNGNWADDRWVNLRRAYPLRKRSILI